MKALFKSAFVAVGIVALALTIPGLALAMGGGGKGNHGSSVANSVKCPDGKYAASAGGCKKHHGG